MIERDKEYYNRKISELYSIIENQENIIRDLQKEVKGYQTMYFDKVMIVNKATEYIKEFSWYYAKDDGTKGFVIEEEKEETFVNELLGILKADK